MYLGLVLFTDICCHKVATIFIPCPSLSLRLSSLPHPTSFKIRELHCSYVTGTAQAYDNFKSVELTPSSSYLLIPRTVEQVGHKREGESAARSGLTDYRKYQQAGGIWTANSWKGYIRQRSYVMGGFSYSMRALRSFECVQFHTHHKGMAKYG
jgi:hypothetical protein